VGGAGLEEPQPQPPQSWPLGVSVLVSPTALPSNYWGSFVGSFQAACLDNVWLYAMCRGQRPTVMNVSNCRCWRWCPNVQLSLDVARLTVCSSQRLHGETPVTVNQQLNWVCRSHAVVTVSGSSCGLATGATSQPLSQPGLGPTLLSGCVQAADRAGMPHV
jgi:hypothetical protein